MARNKVMPGIGCLDRRLYIEARQKGTVNMTFGLPDPCILCDKRSRCVKTTVDF